MKMLNIMELSKFLLISDRIALQFLKYRRPESKNHEARLPHMATYLLEELPVFLTGILYQGTKYQTMVYPTTAAHSSFGLASLIYDVQTLPEFTSLRQEIFNVSSTVAAKGIVVLPLKLVEEEKNLKISQPENKRISQIFDQKEHPHQCILKMLYFSIFPKIILDNR